MDIKNAKLIEILLSSGIQANMLVDVFGIIGRLIKRHGKILYTKEYINEVSKVDENIGNMISILGNANKITYEDTKKLIKIIKSTIDSYNLEFIVNSKVENKEIISYLNNKFKDSKIETQATDILGFKITGEGRSFKKDLDSDLEKLLK